MSTNKDALHFFLTTHSPTPTSSHNIETLKRNYCERCFFYYYFDRTNQTSENGYQ